jgi:hypothetical protein
VDLQWQEERYIRDSKAISLQDGNRNMLYNVKKAKDTSWPPETR